MSSWRCYACNYNDWSSDQSPHGGVVYACRHCHGTESYNIGHPSKHGSRDGGVWMYMPRSSSALDKTSSRRGRMGPRSSGEHGEGLDSESGQSHDPTVVPSTITVRRGGCAADLVVVEAAATAAEGRW